MSTSATDSVTTPPEGVIAPTNEPVSEPVPTPVPIQHAPVVPNAGGGAQPAQPFHSASLYVGDLAPDVNEGLLFEIFNAVGPVASIRVCRDAVTRRSLGYAYINFHQIADAERALDTMNYTMIKTRPCRIMWSQRDPSLRRSGVGNIFVKNLHTSIDNKQLYDTFSLFGNILSCKVVTEPQSGDSKGYGYVHYETAEAANAAIEKLDGMLIDGQEVQVGHFMRRNERPGQSDWTNCYVKNIPLEWDDAKLNEVFSTYGEVISATITFGTPKVFKKKKTQPVPVETDKDNESAKSKDEATETAPDEKNDAPAESEEKDGEETKTAVVEESEESPPAVEKKSSSLGYGFVNFAEHDGAVRSVEELTGTKFPSKVDGEDVEIELFVCRAQKKAERERELRAKYDALKMDRISKFQGVNLYVKNLDDTVSDDLLRDEFSAYGTITSARVMKEAKDGRSKGFGFVCFATPEESTLAVNEMNGKLIANKPIFVALAQRRDVRRAQLEAQHSNRPGPGPSSGQSAPRFAAPMGAAPYIGMGGGAMQPTYPMMAPQMQHFAGRGAPMRGPYPGMMQQQQRSGMYQMPPYGAPQSGGRGGRGGPNQGRGGRGGGRGQPFQGGRGQPQLKFNHQARNASTPPSVPVPGVAPPQPNPVPPPAAPQVPPPPANESLTASALASATPEMQKNMIGERLYPLIHASQPELAGKITGMLLEMDNSELLHLLESPDALNAKISEALQVLEAHNATQD
uniref:PABP n=1 Tax=Proboscia inermis TaxID=420281 RepID=A0A6T8JM21_9STRA|mmetsp:Transcript_29931/g.30262  ORF Transcript_29931/g.30262 Transcript_29931/m.30262 type:complete len:741 (+) Transcript_29931:224-2446(+)|eukprot:CAMPEP_0171295350 /NCGR_PEP_ID=MMETSP0816-20121228/3928_1 /TAXON_ID=420281 /ORGANISM="Proboscia inermis, Strain CCAP1064/1" /LENGTH=740 /DNA_ID=CAMNT_0011767921 /DNA_START=211 /DNA_END=2433 /DNA_ORIENTATION=-